MRVGFRRDLRRDLSYQQGGDPKGELGSQFAVQNRPDPAFENRGQDGPDRGPEARFEPTLEFRAELRLQRGLEAGIQATDEFRFQRRSQTAVQARCDKGIEDAGQKWSPEEDPAALRESAAANRPSEIGRPWTIARHVRQSTIMNLESQMARAFDRVVRVTCPLPRPRPACASRWRAAGLRRQPRL